MNTTKPNTFPNPLLAWIGSSEIALQFDGNDLVHITDYDQETGTARLRVYASTNPEADTIFEGTVHLLAHEQCTPGVGHLLGSDHRWQDCPTYSD